MRFVNFIILVPVYNEFKTVGIFLDKLNASGYPYLVVDDGSFEDTTDILVDKCENYIKLGVNKGKGGAIKEGAKYCIESLKYDEILIMDGDGQHLLSDVPTFIKRAENDPIKGIIIGNRLHNPSKMPKIRYITNKFMSWIISKLSGQKIVDSQCGMRLINKDIFDLQLNSNGFDFDSEMLVKTSKYGYKIINVPIKCVYTSEDNSKLNIFKDTIKFIKLLWRLRHV